jgi:hypothetical protein
MSRGDYTDMGGTGEAFLTTHWSLIEGIASACEGRSKSAAGGGAEQKCGTPRSFL